MVSGVAVLGVEVPSWQDCPFGARSPVRGELELGGEVEHLVDEVFFSKRGSGAFDIAQLENSEVSEADEFGTVVDVELIAD